MRLVRPVLLTAALLAAALIATRTPVPVVQASAGPALAGAQPQSQVVGSGPNRAAVAVKFGDGHVESRCVAFSEEDIGGDELLQRSGLAPAISPEGAVCSIGVEGCPTDDCFCRCQNFQDCQYWAFYHWGGDGWIYSQWGVMAETVVVRNGGMHGWAWGSGDADNGAPAPDVTFDDVCTAAAASNTATPTATATATAETQAAPPGTAPQVTFTAGAQTLVAPQCTVLNWQTSDATSVTLDGAAVATNGSQQVCPPATRTWTLVAVNPAGQTTRQVSIQVAATGGSTPGATPSPRPAAPTAVQRPIMTQPPAVLPTPDQSAILGTQAELAGGVPLAPTAEPAEAAIPTPRYTPTRYAFSLPPTETPRPRRMLGADGPTPTPLLIARAGGARDRRRMQGPRAAVVRARWGRSSWCRAGRSRRICCRSMRPTL